jgi:hypothetical protein
VKTRRKSLTVLAAATLPVTSGIAHVYCLSSLGQAAGMCLLGRSPPPGGEGTEWDSRPLPTR